MGAIYKKELRTYFTTPVGYMFAAALILISAAAFSFTTLQAHTRDTTQYFTLMVFIYIVIVPILTMKSFSEERRTKTEQMLLTSPVSLTGMVMAKYLAAMTMLMGTMMLTLIYYIPFMLYKAEFSTPGVALIAGDMIALFLIGSAFVSIGVLISSLTENQMVACVVTIIVLLGLFVISFANQYIPSYFIRSILSWISIFTRFGNFTNGVFDFGATVYYASITVVAIFLTVRVYEKRRWG